MLPIRQARRRVSDMGLLGLFARRQAMRFDLIAEILQSGQ